MKIRSLIALAIAICSCGGLLLSGAVSGMNWTLDKRAEEVSRGSGSVREVEHVTTLVGQWLVSIDLLLTQG